MGKKRTDFAKTGIIVEGKDFIGGGSKQKKDKKVKENPKKSEKQ